MPDQFVPLPEDPSTPGAQPANSGFTGRFLVAFEPNSGAAGIADLQNRAGIAAFGAREGALPSNNMVMEELGIAVVSAQPDQYNALRAASTDATSPIRLVEPERYVWAAMAPGTRLASVSQTVPAPPTAPAALPRSLNEDFLRGYSAAVTGLLGALRADDTAQLKTNNARTAAVSDATWGLVVTLVTQSALSGQGIRVAVLDTGFDQQHPDFAGRTITATSFVPGEVVQDEHGHGTHCVGTACGPRSPAIGPRYGIAYGSEIYVGKVLNNSGMGTDGQMLAGINWAVQNQCAIVSMSIEASVAPGQAFNRVFQAAASAALDKGTLIFAAAGNESTRPGAISPVGHPANCPSILAVAAVDSNLLVASFSNGAINTPGGEVNISGPGVDVYSSWPMSRRYNTINGTSMATPHVAGIATLFAEATGLRRMDLANALLNHARRLQPTSDFGWGLVQAP